MIESGLDREWKPARPAIEGLAPDARYWLHVGTMTTRKNLRRLLFAYSELLAQLDGDAPDLVLAGKRGPGGERLATLARTLGIAERVHLPGFVPESALRGLFEGAEAYLAPSLHEGFGLAVVEALSMGLPLLCGRGGALQEIDDGAALFVDPRRHEQLVTGMLRLNADAALRQELGRNGRRFARRFSWQRCAEQTREVYLEVLEARRSASGAATSTETVGSRPTQGIAR